MSVKGNKPAFPIACEKSNYLNGMTYREYLIGQALVGACADNELIDERAAASFAINTADEVLKRLEEE